MRPEYEDTQGGQIEEAGIGACVWVGVEYISYARKHVEVECGWIGLRKKKKKKADGM